MQGTNNRPLILVTNDDGYKAKGLLALSDIARKFGDVVVISSNESQSGKSHSITIKDPIKYKLREEQKGFASYIVKGTPADGVKLALNKLLGRKPDLLLSGINHGTNSSTSIVYSGTMAAAIEGAIHEIPAIGLSILDYRPDAEFEACVPFVRHLIQKTLTEGLPAQVCLNVNIPSVTRDQIRGIKVCRQTNGFWKEAFETRQDPRGSNYSWLTGTFINREEEASDTDEWALQNKYISVVPIHIDFTAHEQIKRMKLWEKLQVINEEKK
ncbi:5'/3'-nucleotidase SurE [Bacteroidota bacterium]